MKNLDARPARWRALVALAATLLAACGASAEEPEPFKPYIAYGASATDQEVVAVRFDQQQGKLVGKVVQREPLGFEAAPVVWHPEHRLLYVASLRAKPPQQNQLRVFATDEAGRLTRKADFPLRHGAAYLSLDRKGRYLLAASYFDGNVDVYRLEDGLPAEWIDEVFESRDKAHSILTTPSNEFAYVPYVKDQNAIFQYRFDEGRGLLTPLRVPQAKVPRGIGPRHVAYHPSPVLKVIYFSNEQQLGVSVFRMKSDGRLQPMQICEPGDLKPAEGLAASDIALKARHLFVAVRDFNAGEQDAVHRYKLRPDGGLIHLGATPTDAIPWGLRISPDGGSLLVTAAKGNTLTAYKIGEDGGLSPQTSVPWGKMIRAIAVAELP